MAQPDGLPFADQFSGRAGLQKNWRFWLEHFQEGREDLPERLAPTTTSIRDNLFKFCEDITSQWLCFRPA